MKHLFFLVIIQLLLFPCKANSLQVGAERLDILLPLLKDKNVALVINQTSVVGENQTLLLDTLLTYDIRIKKVFAPEHGFRGNLDAGETVKNSKDIKTGVPIVSIYGKNKKPTAEQLKDIDVVVFDIQDVGARFYTYISTMHYVMEACAENKKEMIVCDRPNPNDFVDGPVLQPDCRSFVGMHPIPVLHGLTVGELALMINGESWLKNKIHLQDLKIIGIKGWKHGQTYVLPVKPSPNLPNHQSIRLYPSLCFFEATNISVGRGTTFPFQVLGAPQRKLDQTDLRFGSFTFVPRSLPGWDKNPLHQDQTCYGVDLRDINFKGGLSLKFFLDFYNISKEKEAFFTRSDWFNLLAGNKTLQKQIISGMNENQIKESWKPELAKYKLLRDKYILYPAKSE